MNKEDQVQYSVKNGKRFAVRREWHNRNCLRCKSPFITPWIRKIYCSRKCYMTGVSIRTKEWYKTEEGKIWKKFYQVDRERNIRIQAIKTLGNKCVHCGYKDIRSLHIDHVHSDGKKERGIRKQIYRKIVGNEIDRTRYQLLCANCNWIKRLENNEGSNWKDYNDFLLREMKTRPPD